jgi:hypothetical protein
VIGFRTSHAVVIGIDRYGHGIPPLRTAVNDARRVAQVLAADYGYDVHLLDDDVTLARLRDVFGAVLAQAIGGDDRLLVYFAGHGVALDGDDGPAGYLIPQDARGDDRASFLPMTELAACLDRLPCRHLLLVLDCCFAGAFRWSSTRDLAAPPDVIHRERFDRYIRDAAWQVLTSAAHDQKALDVLAGETIGLRSGDLDDADHSPFAAALLRALQGEADLIPRARDGRPGGDGVITATELYLYLRECVESGGDGHRQTPGLWPLKKHDKGEFIHLVPGYELNLPPAPPLDEANNPWRGLQSYDEPHASLFFGRSNFVASLAERVRAQSLTVVLGSSGTGKSSVVKAGVVPIFRNNEPEAWLILPPMRPGKSPLAALAALPLPGEPVGPDAVAGRLTAAGADLEALAARVAAWAAAPPPGPTPTRLLLVIDQFEELLTLCWDSGERERFLVQLHHAVSACRDRLRIVLTLRSDFEPQFAHSPLQEEWMKARVVVPAMTLDQYREVIEGPASAKVIYFQGRVSSQTFINRLIGDVANTPGALPLLSFTLSELYRRYLNRGGDDRALSEADYEQLGGVGGSLRNRADEVYLGLRDDDHRETMRRVMLRMVSLVGGELARRRVPDRELVFESDAENGRVQSVVRCLTDARLVVEGKDEDDQPFVEPAHDELVRGWDRLLEWSRVAQSRIVLQRLVTPAATDWSRGEGGLWNANPRLGLLAAELGIPQPWHLYQWKRLRDRFRPRAEREAPRGTWLNREESRFVSQSLERKHRTTTTVVTVTLATVATLAALTVFALLERNLARTNAGIASQNEVRAKKSESRATKALEETQRTLAQSLLSVIGLDKNESLSLVEADSLWKLATMPRESENVRLQFLRRALDSSPTASQLRHRAEPAVRAAVGLDEARRDRVLRETVAPVLNDRAADREIRMAAAAIGYELGALEKATPLGRAIARGAFKAAIDGFQGAVGMDGGQRQLLLGAAAVLDPAAAAAAVALLDLQPDASNLPGMHALNEARVAVLARLGPVERTKALEKLCKDLISGKGAFPARVVLVRVASTGLDPTTAARIARPLLTQVDDVIRTNRTASVLDVLLALAPHWDEPFAAEALPAIKVLASASMGARLKGMRENSNGRESMWGACTSLLGVADVLPWEAPSADLRAAASRAAQMLAMSPGFPIDLQEYPRTYHGALFAMARRMNQEDREAQAAEIETQLATGKFEYDDGRKALTALLPKIRALTGPPSPPPSDVSVRARKAWAATVQDILAPGKPVNRTSFKQPTLANYYPRNARISPDPREAAKAIRAYARRPVPDNMFDMPAVFGNIALLQRIAPNLPEAEVRETAHDLLEALLAYVGKTNGVFPTSDEALEVVCGLGGPGQTVAVIKRLLAVGFDELGARRGPISDLTRNGSGAFLMARALLARSTVAVGEGDLIEIVKYPTCVGELRTLVLSRLERLLKPPASYATVWDLTDDLGRRRPELLALATSEPTRPRPPSPGPEK